MPTIAEFTAFVTDLEKGSYSACFKDRSSAAKQLVGDICTASWETAEQREAAQGLVASLERLRRGSAIASPVNETLTILQQMEQSPHDGKPDDGRGQNKDKKQRVPKPRNGKIAHRCEIPAPNIGEGLA